MKIYFRRPYHESLGQLVALRAAASGAERGDVDGRVGALSLTARAHLRRAVAFRSRLPQLSRGASSSSVASSSVASVALGGSLAGGFGAAGACDGDSTLSPPKSPKSPFPPPLRSWPTRRRDGDDVSGNVERCAVQDSEPAGKQIPNNPFFPYVASPFLPYVTHFSHMSKNNVCVALFRQSLALRMQGDMWLFDCGESTQVQMMHCSVSHHQLTRLFVSHMHGDHCFGIPGLLCGIAAAISGNLDGSDLEEDSLSGRNRHPHHTERKQLPPLQIVGPAGLRSWIRAGEKRAQSAH